jgi:DNA-binding NarL/FixJ family response regulator
MPSVSLLIVDDHPVYRDALHQFLTRKFFSSGNQVFSTSSIKEGLNIVRPKGSKWIILLDLMVPDSETHFFGITEFKKLTEVIGIAAISGLEGDSLENECIEAGCDIFIPKSSDTSYIYQSLCKLMGVSPEEEELTPLTDRQKEILAHISNGDSNKMIAYSLNISEQTVKIHLGEIFKKIKVFNRTQAVIKAKENGWV